MTTTRYTIIRLIYKLEDMRTKLGRRTITPTELADMVKKCKAPKPGRFLNKLINGRV